MPRSLAEHGTETRFDLLPQLTEAIGVQKPRIGIAQLGDSEAPQYLARVTFARLTFLKRAGAKIARKAPNEPRLSLIRFAVKFLQLVKDFLRQGDPRDGFALGNGHA